MEDQYDKFKNKYGEYYFKKGSMVIFPKVIKAIGIRHRLDGPAVITSYGKEEWWIEGKQVSEDKIKLLKLWIENKHG